MNKEKESLAMQQVAALPYQFGEDGTLRILLITSKKTRRWIIPKGNIGRASRPEEAAAKEAFEEAGIVGTISSRCVGSFCYDKVVGRSHPSVRATVQVFPLVVAREEAVWPEMGARKRRWATPDEACELVQENDLREILASFAQAVSRH